MTTKKTIDITEQQTNDVYAFVEEYNNNRLPQRKEIDFSTVIEKVKIYYQGCKDFNKAFDDVKSLYINKNTPKKGKPFIKEKPETKSLATKETHEKAIKELKDPNLLWNIVEETQKEGVIGEEVNIISSEIIQNLRFVEDVKPTSMNHVISGKPGKGKDNYIDALNKVSVSQEDLIETSGVSPKVLDYWTQNPEYQEWDWTGKVLKLADPSEETLKSDTVRTFASGKQVEHTVKDQTHLVLNIKGKPAFTITSYQSTLDIEGERRWEFTKVDETDKLDEEVVKQIIKCRNSKYRENKPIKNENLRDGLKYYLKRFKVDIPFTDLIEKAFSPKIPDSRTKANTFCDYIASSCVLHQYQREKNADGELIATWDDYDIAVLVFNNLKGLLGKSLNDKEQVLVNYLFKIGKPQELSGIEKYTGINRKWLYNHQEDLMDKNIIRTTTIGKMCGTIEKEVLAWGLKEISFTPIEFSDNLILRLSHDYPTIIPTQYMIDCNHYPKKQKIREIINKINEIREKRGLKKYSISQLRENWDNRDNLSVEGSSQSGDNRQNQGSFLPKSDKEKHVLDDIDKLNISKKDKEFFTKRDDDGPTFEV
jgi:hypothetical protein